MMNNVGSDASPYLSASALSDLTKKLVGRENISVQECEEVQKAFDVNGNGLICKKTFKGILLKLEKQRQECNGIDPNTSTSASFSVNLPFGINHFDLEPIRTSPEVFVRNLENCALNHIATKHPFLKNLAAVSFGKEKTADYLLRFLSAYSRVNKGFIPNIKKLLCLLENPKHRIILQENLDEEMGIYDDETLQEVEKQFGVKREVIMNKTHGELFQILLKKLEHKMKASCRKHIPDEVVKPYLDVMRDVGSDQIGLSASLYFGSEIIVPKFYDYILQGLRKSINISNEDAIFFILHIDMDADHADHMREMIVEFSNTYENRLKLVNVTDAILRARVNFYDALVRNINGDLRTLEQGGDSNLLKNLDCGFQN